MAKILEGVARSEAIRTAVLAALEAVGGAGSDAALAANVLPDIRRALAATPNLGGDASLYLGTADPVYYRAIGTARPLVPTTAATTRDGKPSASFRLALAKRRDAGGRLGRWNVLAASAAATLGRPVSEAEAKRLYAATGRDLDLSYTGRGTRYGAPGTYAAEATPNA